MSTRIRTHLVLGSMPVSDAVLSFDAPTWQPSVDIYEMADALLVQVEAPGLSLDDLNLSLDGGKLIVEGNRVRPPLPSPARVALVEMTYGKFRRVLPLPADVDGDAIAATYDAGVLQIHIPRVPRPAPKRLQISAG